MNVSLIAPYTDVEIKKAIFHMHPYKSSGPDDMSPFFYQKYWHVVHHDICFVVCHFLQMGCLFQQSNFTHLTLIPKIKEPKFPFDVL